MRIWTIAVVVGAALGGMLVVAPRPALAEDICGPGSPGSPAAVRGYTWSGHVRDIERREVRGYDVAVIIFEIERVYRVRVPGLHPGPEQVHLAPGAVVRFRGDSCFGNPDLGMRVGRRYLVSTDDVLDRGWLLQDRTVAWELNGDRARFIRDMYNRDQQANVWGGFASARTPAEALAIVAPGAPATDTVDALLTPAPPAGGRWAMVLLAGLAGFAFALWRTRRRSTI